ncbi:terminase large subunit [Listeria monocytogenes]|nr:terminase large subunit [Listeria monocytogenes]
MIDMSVNYADEFCELVSKNSKRYPKSIKKAVKRYKTWKKRKDIQFDLERANTMLLFTETFVKHAKGKWAGQPLILEPWQKFVFSNIYGWVHYDKEKQKTVRVIQKVYLQVPKKQGKSLMGGAPIIYGMYGEDVKGGEFYVMANDFDQAQMAAIPIAMTIENSPDLAENSDIYYKEKKLTSINYTFVEEMIDEEGDDFLQKYRNNLEVLSKSIDGADGKNPYIILADEVHAWIKSERYDNLKSAQGVQDEPLLIVTTTAGKDPNTLGVRIYKESKEILNLDNDDSWFIFISEPNKGFDWEDPEVWEMVNLNLGVSVNMQFIRGQYLEAKRNSFSKAEFMSKQLNVFVNYAECYFELDQLEQIIVDDLSDLENEQCVVGIDLSKTTDLTCVSLNFPVVNEEGKGILKFKQMYFIPSHNIAEKEKLRNVPYRELAERGFLTICDGKTIDYNMIFDYVMENYSIYDILQINYDPAMSEKLVERFELEGIECVSVGQYPNVMNDVIDDFEMLLYQNRVYTDNPLFLFCASNAKIITNISNQKAPSKRKSPEHIDGFVAMLVGHKESMLMVMDYISEDDMNDYLDDIYN